MLCLRLRWKLIIMLCLRLRRKSRRRLNPRITRGLGLGVGENNHVALEVKSMMLEIPCRTATLCSQLVALIVCVGAWWVSWWTNGLFSLCTNDRWWDVSFEAEEEELIHPWPVLLSPPLSLGSPTTFLFPVRSSFLTRPVPILALFDALKGYDLEKVEADQS